MIYLVAMSLEGAAFANDRSGEPSGTYAESYEESQKTEAIAYFWQSVKYAIDNRKRLNEGGAGDYDILLAALINEEAEEIERLIYRVTISPSGAMATYYESEADGRELLKGLRKAAGDRFAITETPILEGQEADYRRFTKPIPKA